jgi:CheY-like chemotaxis protein
MPTHFPESRYKPGDLVPESGVYRIIHGHHRAPHENTLSEGETFPACRTCKDNVRYELVISADVSADGPSLLLVDDEGSVRTTLKQVLQQDGYNVSTAENCSRALGMLRRREYDAVITEMDLETQDSGLDLARSLKNLKPAPLIIFSTAAPTPEKLRAAMRLRINYVVIKPIDLQELRQALSRMIARRAAILASPTVVTNLR